MKHIINFFLLALIVQLFACSEEELHQTPILSDNIEEHIKTLASDAFLGRKPGTEGEIKTINYLQEELKRHGVKPANGNSYLQRFTISEIRPEPPRELNVSVNGSTHTFAIKKDFIAKTNNYDSPTHVENAEMIFAGFGIVAPEYNWNDYENIDVEGKVVVTMYSDPGLYDSTLFKGTQPTPYAYISYKKEEALKRGAIGFFTIFHSTGPTGLNWPLVEVIATRSEYYLEGTEPKSKDNDLLFSGMLSTETTKKLMKLAHLDEDYIAAALSKNFNASNMGIKCSLSLSSQFRQFETHNVIGMVEGLEKPDEVIIYTAHWDHDGITQNPVNGDSIMNGAIDNASGTAMVLETARAFAEGNPKPKRSVLFLLTSAEEMGLLGAKYYANNPIIPIKNTVCVINTDASHATEPMRLAVNVLGGYSTMDTVVHEAARDLGRKIIPDPTPQIGAFQRSDHFPFVQKGVPAVWAVGGGEPMRGDSAKAMQLIEDYGKTKYHQVTDEYYDGFLMGNIELDASLNYLIGKKLAYSDEWPNWNEGIEYKALRDSARLINQIEED